jgi:phosphoserine phosphatase
MRWPHYEHLFFDCDSTLTAVEGIDILAESAGKGWRVGVLTRAAMDGHLDLEQVYDKRLRALKPTRREIQAIRQVYKQHMVEDAAAVITLLQEAGHKVYIISGGLAEPVVEFGLYLGVPRERIRAVTVEYDQLSSDWWQQDGSTTQGEAYLANDKGALTISNGKAEIVRELLGEQSGRSLLIGDGSSDLLAGHAVDLFVGYGGVVTRPRVLAGAPVFLHSFSLAPLLALAAGPAALRHLETGRHQVVVEKAFQLITTGAITFQNERLKSKFQQAVDAASGGPHQIIYPRTH